MNNILSCSKRFLSFLCGTASVLLLFTSFTAKAQIESESVSYDFLSLQQKIQSWVDSGYYSGASIFIAKDNREIYREYFGDYDRATVVYIASAGKWLAAATIAAVVEEGKLSWQDKVKKWLPQFTDIKGEATLAQLMSHTAGYPDYQPPDKPIDIYQTLKESVAAIVDLPADTTPGTRFRYGGLSMNVAGRMAELATGKDWETIFQEKIAMPLGMKYTHFTPVDSSGGHAPMLGGGARSTLEDYTRFLSMIFNDGMFEGKSILSAHTVEQMQQDYTSGTTISSENFVDEVRARDGRDIYGLGEWREETDENGKAVLISSPSWAGAYPWIDKTNGVYGFFLTHIVKAKNGFNSFLASPVIPLYVRDAIAASNHPEIKRGFVPVKNGQLYYEETGEGEPIIFIHGHSFDHTEWEPQVKFFEKEYRVITYDVRGYGRSSMPVEFSNTMHADDLVKLMDALKIKKAHIVGLSMGGFIGLDFLVLHQDRLLSVTLASGDVWNGSPGPDVPWNSESIAKRRLEIEALYKEGIFQFKKKWFDALTTRDGQVISQLRRPVWEIIYKWDAWQPTHIEPRFLLGTSVIDKLKSLKVEVPVLVLTGEFDMGEENKVIALVPSAIQTIVPGAGHVSNLENPEEFNVALLNFIKSQK